MTSNACKIIQWVTSTNKPNVPILALPIHQIIK